MTTEQLNEIVLTVPEEIAGVPTVPELKAAALPFFDQAKGLCVEARRLVVTDPADKTGMERARRLRLDLREIRTGAEKKRKELKEDALRRGNAIDHVFNSLLRDPIKAHEDYLQQQEEFAERQEALRLAELKTKRDAEIVALGFDPSAFQTDKMTEPMFQQFIGGMKAQQQAKREADAKAESERIAKEKAEAEEREAQRKENERLKAEAAERDRLHREEQERAREAQRVAEAKAELERQQREKIEAEQREREAAEAKRKAEEEAAARKAANAPDREKLLAWARQLRAIKPPALNGAPAENIAGMIFDRLQNLSRELESAANRL